MAVQVPSAARSKSYGPGPKSSPASSGSSAIKAWLLVTTTCCKFSRLLTITVSKLLRSTLFVHMI